MAAQVDGLSDPSWLTQEDSVGRRLSDELVRVLYDITREALDGHPPEGILVATARSLAQLGPGQNAATIVLVEEDYAYAVALDGGEMSIVRGDEAKSHPFWQCGWFHTSDGQSIGDLSQDAAEPCVARDLVERDTRSLLVAPLIVGGQQDGVIVLASRDAYAFTPGHVLAAREIARQLSIAVERGEMIRAGMEQRNRLRDLTARMAAFEESERQQLARELHDRIGQNLTALGINLNIIGSLLPPHVSNRISGRLDYAKNLVEEMVGNVRDVMAGLRPAVLDDYGLLAALRWYGERFAYYTGVEAVVTGTEPEQRPSATVEMTLFRIAQEAMTNVAKHAMASKVTVTIEDAADELRLTVADDGIGFDTAAPRSLSDPRWGLINMRERADGVRGRLVVTSRPGYGTQVLVTVPKP